MTQTTKSHNIYNINKKTTNLTLWRARESRQTTKLYYRLTHIPQKEYDKRTRE